jgi:hypothetical protein
MESVHSGLESVRFGLESVHSGLESVLIKVEIIYMQCVKNCLTVFAKSATRTCHTAAVVLIDFIDT